MAKGNRGPASEYAGTDIDGADNGGNAGDNGSGAIDPASIDGSGGGNPGGSDGEQFDPAIHVGPDKRNADGSYTRKRGRKAGSNSNRANPRKAAADLGTSIEALSKTLVIIHTGIAGVTNIPEIAIDKAEGDMLANATANVLAQFDITPDPKTQAIIGMIMACGAVYGPRVMLYRMRQAQERKEAEPGTAGVYDASGNPVGTTEFSSSTN